MASNGQVLATSETYVAKASAISAVFGGLPAVLADSDSEFPDEVHHPNWPYGIVFEKHRE